MSDYIIIECGDSAESAELRQYFDIASNLAAAGNDVTVFFVQNGVFLARRGARFSAVADIAAAGVTLLADDFSLRERGMGADQLRPGVSSSPLEAVVDRLSAGSKVLWH